MTEKIHNCSKLQAKVLVLGLELSQVESKEEREVLQNKLFEAQSNLIRGLWEALIECLQTSSSVLEAIRKAEKAADLKK